MLTHYEKCNDTAEGLFFGTGKAGLQNWLETLLCLCNRRTVTQQAQRGQQSRGGEVRPAKVSDPELRGEELGDLSGIREGDNGWFWGYSGAGSRTQA